jgi:hypothetical protein
MQRDNVGLLQQVAECHALGIATCQNVGHVTEDNAHTEGLGQIRELRSDFPVADDAQRHPAHFVTARRGLVPGTTVHLVADREGTAHQHDDLAKGQLGHRPAIAVRIVEDRDATLVASMTVNLFYSNAEGSNSEQVRCGLENPIGELRLGANAEDGNVSDLLLEFRLREGTLDGIDLPTRFAKSSCGKAADVFQ